MTIFVTGAQRTELVVRALAATTVGPFLAVDLSGHAGGLDVVFGVEHVSGWRWHDVVAAEGEIDLDLLVGRLPGRDQMRVLAQGRPVVPVPPALQQAIIAGGRAARLRVVVEARDPAVVRSLCGPGDQVVVASGNRVRELSAAVSALDLLDPQPVLVVAYAMGGGAAQRVDETLDAAVHFVRRDRRAERALEVGAAPPGRGPLARWAAGLRHLEGAGV